MFGPATGKDLPAIAREFGRRPLVVTGRDSSRCSRLVGEGCEFFPVTGEPTVGIVRDGVARVRERGCDVVISIGGGSAIDAGKAIAILATNSGEPLDYLEVVGRGLPIERAGLPYIAVPTTAGTGSEVTRNAVLGSPEHGVKASLRSPMMLARVAVIDPELTLGAPPEVTASTGLDALTQTIEPYVSRAGQCDGGPVRDGGHAPDRGVAGEGGAAWRGPGGSRIDVVRGPFGRLVAGKRGTGRRAWIRGAGGRDGGGSARGGMRGDPSARDGREHRRIAGASAWARGVMIRRGGARTDGPRGRGSRGRRRMGTRVMPDGRDPAAHALGSPRWAGGGTGREGGQGQQHEGESDRSDRRRMAETLENSL